MLRRVSILAFAAALLSSAGCSKEDDPTYEQEVFIGITASTATVLANGTNTVTLTVTDTRGGPVNVTTNRGTFSGGGQAATVAGASGTLTLVTCNASTTSGCAGVATITASSATGTASTMVAFGSLAEVCATSCSADPGCAGRACTAAGGASGTCSGTAPSACVPAAATCTPSPASATTETSCSDGVDNDCDGAIDCAAAACDAQACGTGSVCQAGACTDVTSGMAIQVSPVRARLPADGAATTAVVVTVTADGAPAAGFEVALATDLGALAQPTATTGPDGKATFDFTSSAAAGVATLTASLSAQPELAARATVTMPRLGSFRLVEEPLQHPVMGARGSAWNELGFIRVQVVDDLGEPYPDGLAVRFEHRPLGGSTLGVPLAPPTAACPAPACVAHDALVSSGSGPADSAGLATGWLYSGTVAGTLGVTATTTAGGVTRSVVLPTAAVVGARASGANFSVVCAPRNVPALAETDCSISLVDAPFTCVALLKDRFNNLLGTPTQVIFASEAGAIGPVATTPGYDPASDPASQSELGSAVQIVNTLGAGLPFDVPEIGGEPSVSHGQDGCGIRSHNPRDGLVTVVAMADGEEAFFDANGNGAYDVDEPFVDLGEPFVDENDNGVWDSGEWFLDVDGNRAYDGPNGTWDATAKIWTQTVVLYTGSPATLAAPGGVLGTRWATDAAFSHACTPTPAPAALALQGSSDGPPPVAAVPQGFVVVASDHNLNRLATATSYAVDVTKGSITADYYGLPSYADGLGLFYRYWPCDQGGTCASQCRATGADAPCLMTPSISGFSCGIGAAVILTGGDVEATESCMTAFTVQTPHQVYGTGKNVIVTEKLSGTVSPPP